MKIRTNGAGGAHVGLFGRSLMHCNEADGGNGGGGEAAPAEPASAATPRVFTQDEVSAIAARARAEGRKEKSGGSTGAAPQIDYTAMAVAMREAFTAMQPAAAPAAPAAPTPPASAPRAPTEPVSPITHQGMVDLFSLTPQQIEQLGPQGMRAHFENALSVGRQQQGIPQRPVVPGRRKS